MRIDVAKVFDHKNWVSVLAKPEPMQIRWDVSSIKFDFCSGFVRLGNRGECSQAEMGVKLFQNLPSGLIVGTSTETEAARQNDAVAYSE